MWLVGRTRYRTKPHILVRSNERAPNLSGPNPRGTAQHHLESKAIGRNTCTRWTTASGNIFLARPTRKRNFTHGLVRTYIKKTCGHDGCRCPTHNTAHSRLSALVNSRKSAKDGQGPVARTCKRSETPELHNQSENIVATLHLRRLPLAPRKHPRQDPNPDHGRHKRTRQTAKALDLLSDRGASQDACRRKAVMGQSSSAEQSQPELFFATHQARPIHTTSIRCQNHGETCGTPRLIPRQTPNSRLKSSSHIRTRLRQPPS